MSLSRLLDDRLFLTERELAAVLGKSPIAVRRGRVTGDSCPFVKIGGSVRYPVEEVRRYLDSLPRFRSTTEADAHKAALASQPVEA
jgi:hypothetical protein